MKDAANQDKNQRKITKTVGRNEYRKMVVQNYKEICIAGSTWRTRRAVFRLGIIIFLKYALILQENVVTVTKNMVLSSLVSPKRMSTC